MRILLIGILAALGLAAAVQAQEERAIGHFAGVGGRAMGMGGAYLAVADDFTAVYWNPAGLAQMGMPGRAQREGYVAFARNNHQNESAQAGFLADSELSNTRFGSLGFVYPVPVYRGSLVLAAGFNRIKDFDWNLRIQSFADSLQVDDTFSHEGELAMTSLAGAVDVSPNTSLGLTVSIVQGEDESVAEFISLDSEEYYEEKRFVDQQRFTDEYKTAFVATFGTMVRWPREDPVMRLGATLTSGSTHQVEYVFRSPPDTTFSLIEYDDGTTVRGVAQEGGDSYKIALPIQVGIGASYQPVPGLWLAASAHFAEWSQSEYRGEDEFGVRANADFETQYEDTIRYHLGAEYQVPAIALDLRVGYYSDPLPFIGPRDPDLAVNELTNPLIIIEQDRDFLTLGAGLLLDGVVQVDAAWTRGRFERAEGLLSEKLTTNRLFGGVGYRF
ncbi:MAG: hypothetical protein GKR89_26825 [Candidatus Latescibacteria bacterium]|nr:hypothetical protein [Candidatus Latescibacterota bacterium]